MKIHWSFFLFLPIAIGIAIISFAFENEGIKIENADEAVDFDLGAPPEDFLSADDAAELSWGETSRHLKQIKSKKYGK